MNKTTAHSTHLIFATVLSLFAQSLLLAPELQHGWLATLPPVWLYFLGSLAFMTNIMLLVALVLDYSLGRRAIIVVLTLILTAFIINAYWAEHMVAEMIILGGASLGIGAFLFPQVNRYIKVRDFTTALAAGVNLLIGVGLLAAPALIPIRAISAVIPLRVIFGVGLTLTAFLGILGFFKPTMARPVYSRAMALPWVLWGALYFVQNQFDKAIVPMAFALVLAITDNIPWRRLLLPANDVLGHWVVRLTAIINIFLIAFISGLLLMAGRGLPSTPEMQTALNLAREIAFIFFNLVSVISIYAVIFVNITVTGLMSPAKKADGEITTPLAWNEAAARFIEPFAALQNSLRSRISWQEKQISTLNEQLATERKRAIQLSLLKELNQQLEPIIKSQIPSQQVSSQLTANAIQRAFGNDLVAIMSYDSERGEFESVAAAGRLSSTIPPGYRQNSKDGIIGRAARLREPQFVSDTRADPEHKNLESQAFLSEIVVPIIHSNQMRGAIVVDDERQSIFDANDIDTIEAAAAQLLAAWERSVHDRHLKELIQGGINLSTLPDPTTAIDKIAAIAQQTLNATFVLVRIEREHEPVRIAHAGYAPLLSEYLDHDPAGQKLIKEVIEKPKAWREPDIHKYHRDITLDKPNLRAFLGMPIRLRRRSAGAILAFGKEGILFFDENDPDLIELLANQAAAAIESAWAYQELNATLNTVEALYQLSNRVIQADELNSAAAAVAETAKNLTNATAVKIVLFDQNKQIEAQVQIDATGLKPGHLLSNDLIYQSFESGQSLKVTTDIRTQATYQIQTRRRQYGVMQLDMPRIQAQDEAKIQNIVNQAAITLERSILLVETRAQAESIKAAFAELQKTYDQTLLALSAALDARDKETEGHSTRVTKMSLMIAEKLGLSTEMLKTMARGALLHDIGKIGISDMILHKPGKLTEDEWKVMRLHPDIGARIIGEIPFLQDAMVVVRYHHERWNGAGYPLGLKATDIPLLARIFSVADVFDALTSIRPYRQRNSPEEAMAYIQKQAGIEFDPEIVETMAKLVKSGQILGLVVPA